MKIVELLAGKGDRDEVTLNGSILPAEALKSLLQEGYEDIAVYRTEGTFAVWGRTRTACFTPEALTEKVSPAKTG